MSASLSSGETWTSATAATLICIDDEGKEHRFECANGFVSRDARRVLEIMNKDASQ